MCWVESLPSPGEVEEVLNEVISLRHSRSIVELDLVEELDIVGGKVLVKLRQPEKCGCGYPFFLAAMAERKLEELRGVKSARVDCSSNQ